MHRTHDVVLSCNAVFAEERAHCRLSEPLENEGRPGALDSLENSTRRDDDQHLPQ